MIVQCKDDNVSTKGLTKGRKYAVISIEDCSGKLYRIIDDNNEEKRYSEDFFDIVND